MSRIRMTSPTIHLLIIDTGQVIGRNPFASADALLGQSHLDMHLFNELPAKLAVVAETSIEIPGVKKFLHPSSLSSGIDDDGGIDILFALAKIVD